MKNLADQILYSEDLNLLYDALNDIAQAHQNGELGDPKRTARIVYKFERFVDIHKVRTQDLITLKEKVEKARTEYRILKQKYADAINARNKTKEVLDSVMNMKMDKAV